MEYGVNGRHGAAVISLAVEARETETGTVTIPRLLTTEMIALGPLRRMKNAINNLA